MVGDRLAGPYDVILADPPWAFRDAARAGARGAAQQYGVLTTDALCALDVPRLLAPDACVALWAVSALLPEAIRVLAAWGCPYRTVGWVWCKRTVKNNPHFGMGHWTRQGAELLLLGIRGKPQRANAAVPQVVPAAAGAHSAKPEIFHHLLATLLGPGRRLELFARRAPPAGWGDATGNEYDGRDVRQAVGLREG
jgi:N6-adenosine-specific RNA methylase IME4